MQEEEGIGNKIRRLEAEKDRAGRRRKKMEGEIEFSRHETVSSRPTVLLTQPML